jgi:hypothetical protein
MTRTSLYSLEVHAPRHEDCLPWRNSTIFLVNLANVAARCSSSSVVNMRNIADRGAHADIKGERAAAFARDWSFLLNRDMLPVGRRGGESYECTDLDAIKRSNRCVDRCTQFHFKPHVERSIAQLLPIPPRPHSPTLWLTDPLTIEINKQCRNLLN